MKAVAAFGWLTAAFGAFAATMALAYWRQQPPDAAMIRFLFSAGLSAAGVLIARRAARATPRIDAAEAERQILHSAQVHKGRITAAEVAAQTPVPLEQASQILEALSVRGLCRMSVAEAGILVFEFPELQPAEPESATERARQAHATSQRTT